MCWNATVSLNTYAFALFTIALAYVNKYRDTPLAVFAVLLLFSSIQLVEGGVWLTLDDARWNRLLSMVAFAIIALEPAAMIATLGRKHATLRRWLFGAYAAFVAAYLAWMTLVVGGFDFRTLPASNGHLEWKWLTPAFTTAVGWTGTLIWLAFFLAPSLLNGAYVAFAALLATFAASVALFYPAHTIGTMWCWVANLIFVKMLFDLLFMQPCMVSIKNRKLG